MNIHVSIKKNAALKWRHVLKRIRTFFHSEAIFYHPLQRLSRPAIRARIKRWKERKDVSLRGLNDYHRFPPPFLFLPPSFVPRKKNKNLRRGASPPLVRRINETRVRRIKSLVGAMNGTAILPSVGNCDSFESIRRRPVAGQGLLLHRRSTIIDRDNPSPPLLPSRDCSLRSSRSLFSRPIKLE